jgi:MFS family permease
MTTSRQERWRAALSVLGNRNFFFVWLSGGLVTMSKAVRNIAVMKLIYDLTGLAAGVGILVGSDILAGVLILPLAGVLADRFDRRRMQIIIDVLRAVLALTIMWSRSALVVYILSFALFILTNCYFPARSAIVPDVVKREQLLAANATSKSLSTLGKVLGPLAGGFVVVYFSLNGAFILSAALYLVSAASMFLVRTKPLSLLRAEASIRAVYEEFIDGLRYVRQNPVVSVVTTIYLTLLIGWGLSLGLDVVFAEQILASDTLSTSQAYSYMTSSAAFGMFLGTLVVTYLGRRFAKKWLWLFGLGVMSLDGLGLAIVSSLSLSLAAKFAHGIGEGLMWSLWPTILQENVEKSKRGRVFGLFVATASIPAVITAYVGGILADHTSVRLVYGITCVWILLTVIGGSFLPKFRAIPVRIPGKESKQEAKA